MKREYKGKEIKEFITDYVILDIETTGLNPEKDKIIEIGALKIKDNQIVQAFSSFINPHLQLTSFTTELTGITDEDLIDAPEEENVLFKFINFAEDNVIMGHNINFDIDFIYEHTKVILKELFINDFIDTLYFSRKYLKTAPNHKLVTLSEYLNINADIHHRALSDCFTTYELYKLLYDKYCDNGVQISLI